MHATESAPKFEQWAIVEIFGHQKYAGLVTEQSLGGTNMVRVDIPETPRNRAFTKFFGGSSIFSLTPVGEEIARAMAANMDKQPVSVYDLPEEARDLLRKHRQAALPAPAGPAQASLGGDELLAGMNGDPDDIFFEEEPEDLESEDD